MTVVHQEILTRTARHCIGEDGIARTVSLPSAEQTRADAQENIRALESLAESGRRYPTLVDYRLLKAMDRGARTYYAGSRQGTVAVMRTFVPSGIQHILIGPDHILFLVGLLLLGGGWKALVRIVTAFTIGHSITLSLAALGIVSPPARLIEPAIALSIVFVGADNLVRGGGRDVRAWIALVFGLVHGFGFANVLREFGLPREALGWSLFSFNAGVEIGQLAIVLVVATLLAAIRRRSDAIGYDVADAGSVVVIAAGSYGSSSDGSRPSSVRRAVKRTRSAPVSRLACAPARRTGGSSSPPDCRD